MILQNNNKDTTLLIKVDKIDGIMVMLPGDTIRVEEDAKYTVFQETDKKLKPINKIKKQRYAEN